MAAITRPGHLDLLRHDAKKQYNMNEPMIPYSSNILIHIPAKSPVYQASTTMLFAVPGPCPSSNACNDSVWNCWAASQKGATKREKPLVPASPNSPTREVKGDRSITPVVTSPSAHRITSSTETPVLPWPSAAR